MFRKSLFIAAHEMGNHGFYKQYKSLCDSQWKSYEVLKEKQDTDLRHMISYAYENVPYYHSLFTSLKLLPKDIRKTEDLEKLPILTKDIIRENWNAFIPINLKSIKYQNHSSSGTTGTPFRYRLSWNDRFLGGAMLYRGWGYGGFELGDKMAFFAGSALNINAKSNLKKYAYETARNLKMLSCFDMADSEMMSYISIMNKFKPLYIRGYASAIYSFADWIEEHDIRIHPVKSVFTTSDALYPHMREKIGKIFQCDIYDNYGLNDGGVSAYECSEHKGLHIDMERSVMEVVDAENHQLSDGNGRILATSLFNYALPLIRYLTGDEAEITPELCSCGRGLPLLKQIWGRSVDVLIAPNGKRIHGWFIHTILRDYDGRGIKEYQVVQNVIGTLEINLVITDEFDKKQLVLMRDLIHRRAGEWNIDFKFVNRIERTGSAKYKFIINNMKD